MIAAAAVAEAAAPRDLPPLPPRCREERNGGVALGDRLDLVALRLAADRNALNGQVRACAGWYDALAETLGAR